MHLRQPVRRYRHEKVVFHVVIYMMRREGETLVTRMTAGQRDLVHKGLMKLGEVMQTEGIQLDLPLAAQ